MGKQRKKWETGTKEAIVLSILRGEYSAAEAARKYGANENQVHLWKAQFLEAGRARLNGEIKSEKSDLEQENERLKMLVAEKELALTLQKKLYRL
jgi:transposase-like protein